MTTLPETIGLLLKNGGLETTFLLGNPIFKYCVSFGEGIHNLEDFGRQLLFFRIYFLIEEFFLDDMCSTWQAIPRHGFEISKSQIVLHNGLSNHSNPNSFRS